MSDRVLAWALRALWVIAPFAAGPGIGSALRTHSAAVRLTAESGCWAVWAAALIALLVAHPISLTVVRCVAPAALGVAVVATSVVGIAYTAVVCVAAALPAVGEVFVNGPAYPNERRYLLGPPGPLLLGPIELAWAAVAGLPVAGALLIAARQWIAGGAMVILAAGAVLVLGRSLYGLALRWVVFVPAGVVLHDPATLADPVLFPKADVAAMSAGREGLDLTLRAPGLALRLEFTEPTPIPARGGAVDAAAVVFRPTRPGAVLAEAARRNLGVG